MHETAFAACRHGDQSNDRRIGFGRRPWRPFPRRPIARLSRRSG